ncbi:hypothetical protein HID58_061633 [Brassica napus]|uniref:Uncharacterized protein n=1 Tax=Brassica napus TaxID=3708 RepID=A0ABQ7ZZ56_BRANA|nr:hypothetical protein HID58_061633 [Brassica napus]
MRGMYEFFVLHLFDERREKICLAGERGLLWAKYVDGMLNLAFSVDARGFVHNYPSFSREFVDRMNYMITTSLSSSPWVIEPVFVVSLDGSRTRWTCNRCFWQCAAWDLCNNIHLASGIFT